MLLSTLDSLSFLVTREPRSAGLSQYERKNRPGTRQPEGPSRDGDRPSAVDEIVNQHDALPLNAGEGRFKLRTHHEPVPDSGQPVGAVAAAAACGSSVFQLQLAQVGMRPMSEIPRAGTRPGRACSARAC